VGHLEAITVGRDYGKYLNPQKELEEVKAYKQLGQSRPGQHPATGCKWNPIHPAPTATHLQGRRPGRGQQPFLVLPLRQSTMGGLSPSSPCLQHEGMWQARTQVGNVEGMVGDVGDIHAAMCQTSAADLHNARPPHPHFPCLPHLPRCLAPGPRRLCTRTRRAANKWAAGMGTHDPP
jgi:hypothetical protein